MMFSSEPVCLPTDVRPWRPVARLSEVLGASEPLGDAAPGQEGPDDTEKPLGQDEPAAEGTPDPEALQAMEARAREAEAALSEVRATLTEMEAQHRDEMQKVSERFREIRMWVSDAQEALSEELRDAARAAALEASDRLFDDPPEALRNQLVEHTVQEAVRMRGALRIRLHPERIQDVIGAAPDLEEHLVPDPDVGTWGFRAEWADHVVDGTLRRIRERVREAVESHGHASPPSPHAED